ncbi:hypothetical protein RJ55_00168 [Drechmeria coniospora]|nr:hypothetical protein RJ55_00168 [Drechmeria coniospora]
MDAATIEETNRIRISLGMKPLPVPGADTQQENGQSDVSDSDAEVEGSTLETRQAQAYDNYKSHMDSEVQKKKREERAAAVRKAREKAQRFALVEGQGLGDDSQGGDLDAKSWLMGQKKRLKKISKARKLEDELAAAEEEAAAAIQYTSRDLAGMKVAHDSSAFLEGDEQVLTLKDTTIDENEEEGDELENLDIRDQEKLTERLDLKKQRFGYNPNNAQDDEEDHGILAQYDEEIVGKKRKKFTLDSDGAIAELSDILGQPAQRASKVQTISLDDVVGDAPVSSDYLAPSEIKIKKPKKRKTRGVRQRQHDEDDSFPLAPPDTDADAMDTDARDAGFGKKRQAAADEFVDDEDLQASLAMQRRSVLKKRKKTRPEDIAKQLKELADDSEGTDDARSKGLVIGEISEFVAGLSKRSEEKEQKPRQQNSDEERKPNTGSQHQSNGADEDVPMDDVVNTHDGTVSDGVLLEPEDTDKAVEEEKAVGSGMGAALSLLRERGLIEESRGESTFQNHLGRQEFMRKKRELEEELDEKSRQQRERDRSSGKLDRMSKADREEYARQQNAWREHQFSRKMAELISSNYKPNVELTYTDEHGRSLDRKEAFKHLSHQFHGKGSGKGKTEKKLKQIEDEKRREAQSLFDPNQNGGMNAATAQQLKKRKEAGVRLI